MIFIYIIVIVPIFLAGIFIMLKMTNLIEDSLISNSFKNADRLKARITDTLSTADGISRQIYSNEEIRRFLMNDNFSLRDYNNFYSTHSFFKNYINAFSQIKKIKIYTEKDLLMYNSEFYSSGSFKNTTWYNEAKAAGGQIHIKVFEDSTDGIVYLHLTRAILSGDDCLGVIVITISPDWIERMMATESDNVIFSAERGKIYYSNIETIKPGSVVGGLSEDILQPDLRTLTEVGFDNGETYNILETFTYEDPSNILQVFVLTPVSEINAQAETSYSVYVWYMSLCFILSFLIILLFTSMFSNRVEALKMQMHNVASGDFSMSYEIGGKDEIADLNDDLCRMVNSMQSLIKEAYDAKIQAEQLKLTQSEAEFKALASQINPHFLYNSLETIRMKAFCSGDKETAALVKKLGKIMRRCLEVKDSAVTLGSELEFTENYLELQKARFGDRISYSIVNEVEKDYLILPLVIQPVVENAFVHGVESSKVNGKRDIKIRHQGNSVIIDVIDNGCGMSPERLEEIMHKLIENDTSSGKSIGLTNVNSRIKMAYGDSCGLTISSVEGKGTKVSITLPYDTNAVRRLQNAEGSAG